MSFVPLESKTILSPLCYPLVECRQGLIQVLEVLFIGRVEDPKSTDNHAFTWVQSESAVNREALSSSSWAGSIGSIRIRLRARAFVGFGDEALKFGIAVKGFQVRIVSHVFAVERGQTVIQGILQ